MIYTTEALRFIPSSHSNLSSTHSHNTHDTPRSGSVAMGMLSNQPMRQSLQVAPLSIQKARSASISTVSTGEESAAATSNLYTSQMTPPITPNGSQEDLSPTMQPPPVFHNFLRAFYPFHPSYAMSDSTVTLPLNEGDVILVHSVHTNGWADGTLLLSGARGWLPTNYCESYDPEEMRNLLSALLNFWDLLRSTSVNDGEVFGNQGFMGGIIAGVRYLLVRHVTVFCELLLIFKKCSAVGLTSGRWLVGADRLSDTRIAPYHEE